MSEQAPRALVKNPRIQTKSHKTQTNIRVSSWPFVDHEAIRYRHSSRSSDSRNAGRRTMGKRGTKDQRTIGRREFLRLSAVIGASAGIAACGGEPPAPVVAPTSAAPAAAPTAAPAAAAATAAPA